MMQERQYKASISLHKAITSFLEAGYLVFNNVSEQGSIDIIVVNPYNGDPTYVDVKTASPRPLDKRKKYGHYCGGKLKPKQKELGVRLFLVNEKRAWFTNTDGIKSIKTNEKGELI